MINPILKGTQKLVCLAIVVAVCLSSCTRNTYVQNGPPGQVKKSTGSQSARNYAPGQMKKH